MLIEFDSAKDAANRAKHGIGLGEYAAMEVDAMTAIESHHGGEHRYIQMAPIRGRLHVAVVTYRGDAVRVISLRRANRREERRYAEIFHRP